MPETSHTGHNGSPRFINANDRSQESSGPEAQPTKPASGNLYKVALIGAALILASSYIHHAIDAKVEPLERNAEDLQVTRHRQNRLAKEFGQLLDIDARTILGRGLKDPQTLPGYLEGGVTPEKSRQLSQSTVLLLSQKKGSQDHWKPVCSGAKIDFKQQSYVITASHCLEYSFYPKAGHKAENVIKADQNNYAISSPPNTNKGSGFRRPVGIVTGISVPVKSGQKTALSTTDIALLRVQANSHTVTGKVRTYDAIRSLDVENRAKPRRGEQVALFSFPQTIDNLDVAIAGIGTYLGELRYTITGSQDKEQYSAIGLNVYDARQNPLEHGGSGSFGMGSVSGYIYGPAAWSIRSPDERNKPDSEDASKPSSLRNEVVNRLEAERQLQLDLSAFTTVGGMATRPAGSLKALVYGLKFIARPAPIE